MSRTIDERVVSMQFDNKQFENNVRTSLGTIEKLKQSLNFKGASKGIENVNTAVKRCTLSPLSSAVDSVKVKFSAMEVMAVTALSRITNSAITTGKRMASALTIDPVKSGLQEYETQINAIQTILANTESKGETLDTVNAALDTLNAYADKTIYNFTEMTRNIGTFTAAGVELDVATNAIQGIANLAAVSGSNAQQASTAMYQLSQALASGTVKLMDWNSVVNAGMGGQVFQDALKETARVHGVAIDDMIKKNGSFRETLKDGWLTSEILTETLQKFTLTTEGLTEQQIEANRQMLKSKGYTEDQIKEIFKLGETATNAATKVKTFTQLWDTLKEAAQSGWTQTWELIVGDFGEAKTLWTAVSDEIGGMIGASADRRNKLFSGALVSNWDRLTTKITDAGIETEKFENTLKETAKSHNIDVDKLIKDHGSLEEAFKSGAISSKILGEAVKKLEGNLVDLSKVEKGLKMGSKGDDVKSVQKALKDLGYDLGDFGEGGIDGIIGSVTEKAIKEFQKAQGLKVTGIIDEETLTALEKASGSVDGLYDSVKGLINEIDKLGGRDLLLKSFANIWNYIKQVATRIKIAFRDIFPPATSAQLYKFIKGFHDLTSKLKLNANQSNKLYKTFRGLFAVIDIITTIVGGGLKTAFKVLSKILGSVDLNILDVTAAVGDAIYKFRDWLFENNRLADGFEKVVGWAITGAKAVRDWVKAFVELPIVQDNIAKIREAFGSAFDNFPSIFKDVGGFFKTFWESLTSMDTISLDNVKQVFIDLWENIRSYFTNMENPFSGIIDAVKNFYNDVVEYFGGSRERIGELKTTIIDFAQAVKKKLGDNMGKILALGTLITFLLIVKKIKDAIETIANPFDMLGDFLDTLGNSVKKIAKSVAIKNVASSIAILAASVAVLALLPQKKVWSAVGAIVVLGAGLVVLTKMMDKIDAKDLSKLSISLLSMGGALLLMALAVRTMGGMEGGDWLKGTLSVAAFMGMIAVIAKSTKDIGSAVKIDAFARMMLKMSFALLGLALVVKIFGSMDTATMLKGGGAVVTFLGTMVLMMWATKLIGAPDVDKFGIMMLKLSAALLLMGIAIKVLGGLDFETAIKGGGAAAIFLGTMVGLMWATKLIGDGDMAKFGKMMLGIGASLILMAGTIKILAGISAGDIAKGEFAILGMAGIIVGLMAATKLLGKYSFNSGKVGVMMLGFAAAVLMITGSILMLSMIDKSDLAKAMLAVTGIGVIIGGLLFVTKYAKSIKVGTILAMSIAIGVLAASVAALSFIEGKKLAGATLAISAITGMFALLAASVKTMSIKTMASLGVMVLAVGALAYILYKLTEVSGDSGAVIKMAAALSTLILSLSGSCVLLAGIGATGPAALWGVLILAAVLAVIAGFVALGIGSLPKIGKKLSEFAENLKPFIEIVKEIDTELQAGMKTLAETILTLTKAGILDAFTGGRSLSNFAKQLKPFAEGLAEFSSVVSGESFNASAINNAANAASALVNLANALPVQPGWIQKLFFGEKDLGTFGDQLKGFGEGLSEFSDAVSGENFDSAAISSAATAAEALVGLANKIPDNEGAWIAKLFVGHKDLGTFGTQLKGLGEGLVSFSNSVTGESIDAPAITAAAEATGALADVAEKIPDNEGAWISKLFVGNKDLSTFGTQLVGLGNGLVAFSESVTGKSFDSEAVSGAAKATGALAEVAAAIPDTDGAWISKLFVGSKDLSTFGTQLAGLGAGLVSFSDSITGSTFDVEAVSGAAKATESLAEVAAAIPDTDGAWVSKLFVGHKDLSTFGTQLVGLGNGLVSFSQTLTGNTFDAKAVSSAAKATSGLAEVAAAIPDTDGAWVSKLFVGHKDLSTFGTQLVGLGNGLVSFSDTITGHSFDSAATTAAAKAATGLAELAVAIPDNTGAWVSKLFVGNKDLSEFGTQLSGLGSGLVAFSESVTGKTFDSEAVSGAAGAAGALVDLANELPEGTSWIEKFFFGKEDLSTFGTKLTSFGQGLSGFSEAVTGLNTDGMTAAATAASIIVGISKDIGEDSTDNLSTLGGNILSFGKQLGLFFDEVDLLDTAMISSIGSAVEKIVSLGSAGSSLDFSALGNLSDSLGKIGTDSVDKFVSAFNEAGPKVTAAALVMSTSLISGLSAGTAMVPVICKSVVSAAATALGTGYSGFYNAGKNVVQGFANGITANTYLATAKAKAMAQKAYQAAKEALNINSPSKLFRSLGTSVPEGFAIGIGKLGSMVRGSAIGMAETAIDSTKSAIARLADTITSDVNTQPTIRPVLDLSDVAAGANSIGGMFSMSPSVGVMSNIGAISASMTNRQNGSNGDVISAIEKLGNKLGKTAGDTYNVNGVTYDDGSNISHAVSDIVRAAKIERRR